MRWSEIIRSNKKPSCRCPLKFFLNGPSSASFSFIFSVFLATNTYFTTNLCEKCPSSIRCQDLNSQPSEQESLPITTSTRAPALGAFLCKQTQTGGVQLSFRIIILCLLSLFQGSKLRPGPVPVQDNYHVNLCNTGFHLIRMLKTHVCFDPVVNDSKLF